MAADRGHVQRRYQHQSAAGAGTGTHRPVAARRPDYAAGIVVMFPIRGDAIGSVNSLIGNLVSPDKRNGASDRRGAKAIFEDDGYGD